MDKNNKLQLANALENLTLTDTKELGEAIYAEALEREKNAREDRVILEVQRLEESRLDYARKALFATNAANWYARKLDAVKAGEFTLDLVHGQMNFNDPELQRANY